MPMVLPVIAAFAAGTAGVAAIGAATSTLGLIAGYASVAGAVLTGVGALTGSKDLMKIGAVLSIGGGLASIGLGATEAAASAASGAAASGAEALGEAGGYGASATSSAEAAAGAAVPQQLGDAGMQAAGESVNGATVGTMPTQAAKIPTSLLEAGKVSADPNSLTAAYQTAPNVTMPDALTKLQEAAANASIKPSDVNSWWERAKNAGGAIGSFIEKNPSLVKIGGEMLNGAFGPQAAQTRLMQDKFAAEQSLISKARESLNSPIKMAYTPRN